MKTHFEVPEDEEQRISDLKSYRILDTPEEDGFNALVKLAAQICASPISQINFVDGERIWSKAGGSPVPKETHRGGSFCNATILQDEWMIVEDAGKDERFSRLPIVQTDPGFRFYAGVNLKSSNGNNLGTICVLDYEPGKLEDWQLEGLMTLASEVQTRLELRRKTFQLELLNSELEEKETLLAEIHHRIKNNLAVISGLLQLEGFNTENADTQKVLQNSHMRIRSMVSIHELLHKSGDYNNVSFAPFIEGLLDNNNRLFKLEKKKIRFNPSIEEVSLSINQAIPAALILNELVTNACKHAFHERDSGKIDIQIHQTKSRVSFRINDNGIGLPEDFELGTQSTIGFTLINILSKQLEAKTTIDVKKGTSFTITFDKD